MHVAQGLLRRPAMAALAAALSTVLPLPVAALNEGAGRGWEQTTAADPSFFASIETRSADLTPVAKWRAVLDRYASDRTGTCAVGAVCPDRAWPERDWPERAWPERAWSELVAALRPLAPTAQLQRVTAALNATAYVSDRANWGVSDYWQTPAEFLARGGDCEDFAIAKYLALREAGWAAEDLRIAVVTDERRDVAHAVLIASHAGRAWVLDNLNDDVIEARAVHHYRPVFSVSETAWWWHRPAPVRHAGGDAPASR